MQLGTCIGSNVYNMHAQYLGRYLEGQGHSMTLKQNSVRPITLLFKVELKRLFQRIDRHIETTCRAQNLGRYLKGQGHSMTLKQNRVLPITSLFEVGFLNYYIEMITIMRRHVTNNIWVDTLKVKVTA